MKLYTIALVLLLLMIIISDIFFYYHLKRKDSRTIYLIFHLIPAVFFAGMFFYVKFGLDNSANFRVIAWVMWLYFFFFMLYVSKLLHIIFYFFNYLFKKIFHHDDIYFDIVRYITTATVIVTMTISTLITPRNFDVTNVQVVVEGLPPAFEGYKIAQFSDIHLGSWNRKFWKINKVVTLVNAQNPDIIVFTGDMVNNFATETTGWEKYFNQFKANDGKFAVLGNHDYGDYIDWKSPEIRNKNNLKIQQAIRDFGFRLLLNEHLSIKKGNDSLVLIGVENWGKSERWRYSDLNKALEGTNPASVKVLLTHDPNHFEKEVIGKDDIALTLSGHTHAGQMGLKIGGKLYSPASFVFKYWSGLYKVQNQYIYVNRGIGYIGMPMFIGVRPEITIIELIGSHKKTLIK